MTWHGWLCILLIAPGCCAPRRRRLPLLARLIPTMPSRSPWGSRCTPAFASAVTGPISKDSLTGRNACPWATFRPRRTMKQGTPGTMPTSGCSTSSSTGADTPPRYRSAMPAYQETLSDAEIWAVLDFIKSRWPATIRAKQEQ